MLQNLANMLLRLDEVFVKSKNLKMLLNLRKNSQWRNLNLSLQIEILKEFENPLLKRKELECIVRHPRTATPTRAEIRDKLAALLNCDKETLFVEKILSEFGVSVTKIYARVYSTPSEGEKIEPSHIIVRNRGKTTEE